jgi:hypothetical protein
MHDLLEKILSEPLKEKSSGRDPLLSFFIPQPFAGCPGITLPVLEPPAYRARSIYRRCS